MSLNVKTRKVGGIVVVDMSGRLTIGEPVLLLRETLRVQVNDGARQFVLNLGDVSYIDSSGLGELVSAYTTVRNKQGDVKLLNLTAKAKDLLQMTKLLTVFDVYDDESKAVSALKASRTSAYKWRKCVGVEPTGRRFPDAPQALKARRVTGPYSLP